MATVQNIELTYDQLLAAIRRLPDHQKLQLWQILDAEVHRDEIRRRARAAVEAIWAANQGFSEDEVMADVEDALRATRAEQAARRS
ncbi:MAG: hypothetical protein AB1817_20435 [Chloroflexota bacterium]